MAGDDKILLADKVTALNSKGLRQKFRSKTRTRQDKVTALNSKGLRHKSRGASPHRFGQSNCPEFKGIKTGMIGSRSLNAGTK